METIQQQIDAARRRLVLRQWAGRLGWCWTIAFAIALVALLAPKVAVIPGLPAWWAGAWLAGAAGVGLLVATAWTYAIPRSRLDAAVEIDQRYGLRERVASALSLGDGAADTPTGKALLRDAERAVQQVRVAERFTFGLDHAAWRPAGAALAAVLVAVLLTNRQADASAEPPPIDQQVAKEAKEAAEKARRELKKRREEADKRGLSDASALLKKVEEGTAELAKKEPKDPAKTAVKLNDLSRQLEERRKKLGGGKQLRDQLNRMKEIPRGPADKAAAAMQRGDWKRAMKEIDKLRAKIATGAATEKEREQLAKQLDKMQQQLNQAAEQAEAKKEELERQLAEAQRKGDLNQAGKLQQKLNELAQQAPAQQKLQQMAQQMGQAQQALQQGDPKRAADAMKQLAQQMQQMQQANDEMEMLDAALADLKECKNCMACNKPGGQQMGQAPGQGFGQGFGQGRGKGKGQGQGMGEGQGQGLRPDEKNDVAFRDTRVKQNVGRGASTFGGLVDGPSRRGEVAESIKTPLTLEAAAPADPLTSERLPRSRREHAEEYFRGLRERL